MPIGLPSPIQGLGDVSPDGLIIGTGASVPPGIESVIEYGGLLLNQRNTIDQYRIIRMGGLEDAEIRDDRDVNPQSHGETAFDSFYGGRTITLEGKIRAFHLHKLRDMQQALKRAFSSLAEQPLIFHRLDKPLAGCMIYCRKNAPLQMGEEQTTEGFFERPFLITLRASNFRFLSLYNEYRNTPLGVVDDFSEDSLAEYSITRGDGSVSISDGKLAGTANQFARLIRDNHGVFVADNEVAVRYEPNGSLTGSEVRVIVKYLDDDNFIYARINDFGQINIRKVDNGSDSLLAGSTWTGGSIAPARSLGSPYWLRLRIQGSVLRADHSTDDMRTNPSSITNTGTVTLTGGDATKFGAGVPGRMGLEFVALDSSWRYDDLSMGAWKMTAENLVSVENNGNFSAQPVIVLKGEMENPILTEMVTGQQIIILGSIPGGDEISLDIANDTIQNADGENRFNQFSIDSDWLELVPGESQFVFSASNIQPHFTGGGWHYPSVSFDYRHAYI